MSKIFGMSNLISNIWPFLFIIPAVVIILYLLIIGLKQPSDKLQKTKNLILIPLAILVSFLLFLMLNLFPVWIILAIIFLATLLKKTEDGSMKKDRTITAIVLTIAGLTATVGIGYFLTQPIGFAFVFYLFPFIASLVIFFIGLSWLIRIKISKRSRKNT